MSGGPGPGGGGGGTVVRDDDSPVASHRDGFVILPQRLLRRARRSGFIQPRRVSHLQVRLCEPPRGGVGDPHREPERSLHLRAARLRGSLRITQPPPRVHVIAGTTLVGRRRRLLLLPIRGRLLLKLSLAHGFTLGVCQLDPRTHYGAAPRAAEHRLSPPRLSESKRRARRKRQSWVDAPTTWDREPYGIGTPPARHPRWT